MATALNPENPGAPPHLLYVAWGFPPGRGPGTYRALATANAFVQAGWDVTVLTVNREVFEQLTAIDPLFEAAIDERVKVVRAPFDLSDANPDLKTWTRSRVRSPLWWNYLKNRRETRQFPEARYGAWLDSVVSHAFQIHREKPVSLTIGSANPNVDFMPGYELHKKHGIPYVMDYRDTWHLDLYSGKRIGSPRRRSARLEKKLLSSALEAWFVNKPLRDWHATTYRQPKNKYHVVANGFDPEFLNFARTRVADPKSGLVFGFLGTIYGHIALRETLEGWRIARSKSELLARSAFVIHGKLGHYSTPDTKTLNLLREYKSDAVQYEGPVSKTRVGEVYNSFDALLLILAKSKYITSGKVFEYAATGLPIASLHDRETAATTVLEHHPEWFPAPDLSIEGIANTLIALGERAATMSLNDVQAAQKWAEHLSRDKQLSPRIAALSSIISGRRS